MSFKKIFKPAIIVVACLIFLPLVLFAGILIALTIPYFQLSKRVLRYIGQTSYRLGYSFLQNKYITHSFSPAYLSVVLAAADIT